MSRSFMMLAAPVVESSLEQSRFRLRREQAEERQALGSQNWPASSVADPVADASHSLTGSMDAGADMNTVPVPDDTMSQCVTAVTQDWTSPVRQACMDRERMTCSDTLEQRGVARRTPVHLFSRLISWLRTCLAAFAHTPRCRERSSSHSGPFCTGSCQKRRCATL